ncbi:MAG: DUF47 domain-containing protein [Solirubrobacterales bacterium]
MQANPVGGSIGLNIPNEWWPSPAMLKSLEAPGFGRVQVHAPPPPVLSDPGQCSRHASALAAYRQAVASLFDGGIDPMVVIRWKDVYQGLEDAIDRSRRAMDILNGLVVKHS